MKLKVQPLAERIASLVVTHSKKVLADGAGVTQHAIMKYAKGQVPNAVALAGIQRATGCDGHWLLTGAGVAFPPQQPADPAGQSSLSAAISSAADTAVAALTVLASIAPLISSPAALPDETRLAFAITAAQRALADRRKSLFIKI